MSEENTELDQEGDADFDAGFSGDVIPPTETPEIEPDAEPSPEPEVQPEEPPKYHQVTQDEWEQLNTRAAAIDEIKATHGKQFDTAFGKIGGLERVLKQFQEQTPTGHAVEVTSEDLADLSEEFPDLGAPMLAALKNVAGKMRGTGGGVDEGQIHKAVEPLLKQFGESAVTRAKVEITEETLDDTHSDWREVIGLPDGEGAVPDTEYRKWLNTQPQDYQDRIARTYSASVLGRSIDKFREHSESLKKDSDRRDRFEQAVTPKGDAGHPPAPDGDDDFEAGFNGR